MLKRIKELYQQFCNKPFPKSGPDDFAEVFDILVDIDGDFAGLISSYIKGIVKVTAEKWRRDYIKIIEDILVMVNQPKMKKINKALCAQYKDYLQLMQKMAYLVYQDLQQTEKQKNNR